MRLRFNHSNHRVTAILYSGMLLTGSLICSAPVRSQDLRKLDVSLIELIQPNSARTFAGAFSSTRPVEPRLIGGIDGKTEQRYSCIIYTTNGDALKDSGYFIQSVLPNLATAWLTPEEITRLSYLPFVKAIRASGTDHLHNEVPRGNSGAGQLQQGALNNTPYTGKGVIVAIYDTGIDWGHPDFRDPADQGKSRILKIWDQTLNPIAAEVSPASFSYGVEYTRQQLNDELDGSPTGFVREQDINGHGTHVAGTAAGNGAALLTRKYMGMAPDADIVVIKGGNGSFSESNTVDAAMYCQQLSIATGRPVVLNMSIGGVDGPHDGTLADEQAIDAFTASGPGRVAVISAGNDNNTNIHKLVSIPSSGSSDISFNISSSTTASSVMQFNAWFSDALPVTARVTAPGGETLTVGADQFHFASVIAAGFNVAIDNNIDPGNEKRYVRVSVTRNNGSNANPQGIWKLTLTNSSASSRTVHGWMVYLDPALSPPGLIGGDNNYLVGSPGNAGNAITVASYVGQVGWYSTNTSTPGAYSYNGDVVQDNLSTFSSFGPRRDGVQKPDITAQGQAVISCLSSNDPLAAASPFAVVQGFYRVNAGTSMACPVVAGCVALMLQARPTATYAQIRTAISATASTDALTSIQGSLPNRAWGAGRLNAFRAAAWLFSCPAADRKTFGYDEPYAASADINVPLNTTRVAVRFSPDISGELGGIFFSTVAPGAAPGGSFNLTSLQIEIHSKSGINPGAILGIVNVPPELVTLATWNYFSIDTLHIPVTAGADYFAVLVPGNGSTWGLHADNVSVDGRSLFSNNAGISWSDPGVDFRIRSVVYNSINTSAPIATATSSKVQGISTNREFYNASCETIAYVKPAGVAPIFGSLQAKVFVDAGPQTAGSLLYVGRHYDLQPSSNPANAGSRLTLYFKQAEFTAFNDAMESAVDLPSGPSDATGISNLRVAHYKGTSPSGVPGTYSGEVTMIDPDDTDVHWSAVRSRWEISFQETGNGGFFIQTSLTVLPLNVEYFRGQHEGKDNLLTWKADCPGTSAVTFQVERSADGAGFSKIGVINASEQDCMSPFSYTDRAPLPGLNYYRVKITEANGHTWYTGIVLLRGDGELIATVRPSLLKKGELLQVNLLAGWGTLVISDATGRVIWRTDIYAGTQAIHVPFRSTGIYLYKLIPRAGLVVSGKLLVE